MAIRGRSLQAGSVLKTKTSLWTLFSKAGSSGTGNPINVLSLTGLGVSTTPLTGSSFYTAICQSLLFTGTTLDNGISLLVVGENQFGETVQETVVLPAVTNLVRTTFCYRRVTSITITVAAGALGADDTLTVGYDLINPRIPLLAKLEAAGSVLAVKNPNALAIDAISSFTVSLAPQWNILCTGTMIGNPFALYTVYLNPEDGGL